MKHPITGIVGDELDIGGFGNSHENRILRAPSRLRLPSSFGTRDHKCVPVQVNWVMIHSEIDEAQPNAIIQSND